jgi:hypothetical protein
MKCTKKYTSLAIAGMLSIMEIVGCTDDSQNADDNREYSTDTQDNTGDTDVEAGTNPIPVNVSTNATKSLNLTGRTLSSYAKTAEAAAIKTAIQENIAANFPSAQVTEMDLDNGSVSFTKEASFFDPMVEPEGLPSDIEADIQARDLLGGLRLLPDNEGEIVVEHIGAIMTAGVDKSGNATTKKNLVTVYYSREIDGLPVKGNSRMVTYLGKDGELNGVIRKWTKVKTGTKLSSKEVKSTTAAVSDLKKLIQNQFANYKDKVQSVNIGKVELVMYDDGNVIEPALYSEGDVANMDGDKTPNYWITPILSTPKAKYGISEKAKTYSTHPGDADENTGGQSAKAR